MSLITQRAGVAQADACRAWVGRSMSGGDRIVVPEIIDYELRRELLRANKSASVDRLDAFAAAVPGYYLPITTAAIRLAAQLWAEVRQRGLPTADPRDLDIDVLLAAQALSLGVPSSDLIVATSNPTHLSRFVRADVWQNL